MSRLAKTARDLLFAGRLNDWQTYHQAISSHLSGVQTVLDIGCGRGLLFPFPWASYPAIQRIGLDPDPSAAQNPGLSAFHLLSPGSPWPVEPASIDLAVARYVLEHVEDPRDFFHNLQTCLKPGGRFIFLTPNRLHPAMIVSRSLPHAAKQAILKWTSDVQEDDVFPTFYRINTPPRLRALAEASGLRVERLEAREYQPVGYLDFSLPTFALAYAFHKALQWTDLEATFGAFILGIFQKIDPTSHS